jgi:hypothetical protein
MARAAAGVDSVSSGTSRAQGLPSLATSIAGMMVR